MSVFQICTKISGSVEQMTVLIAREQSASTRIRKRKMSGGKETGLFFELSDLENFLSFGPSFDLSEHECFNPIFFFIGHVFL
mgnify:CR=1 FL=1